MSAETLFETPPPPLRRRGRPRSARLSLEAGATEAIEWLRRVVAGERLWTTVDKAGEESVRAPTGDETMAACDKLLKYAAGVTKEPEPTPRDEVAAVLDRLSREELTTVRSIMDRADAAS